MANVINNMFVTNDIIKMVLDIPNKMLIYYKNNEMVDKFENVDVFEKYYLAICTYSKGDCIQIMDFKLKTTENYK